MPKLLCGKLIKDTCTLLHTKFYQNHPSFVEDMTKKIWHILAYFFLAHGVCSVS